MVCESMQRWRKEYVGTAVINPSIWFVGLRGGMPCHVKVEISHCSRNLKIKTFLLDLTSHEASELH